MLQLARPKDREEVEKLACQIHAMHVAWRPDIYEMVQQMFPEERFEAAVQNRELYAAVLDDQVV